jgi:NitT/TauT family transport system substrate-binding protein
MRFNGCRLGRLIFLATLSIGQFLPLSAPHAQTQKVRIAHSSRSNTTAPFYVAVSKGLFKEEGLEAELIQVNPRLGAMAVINGDVSFTTSFVSTFRGILQGLPLKLVMVGQKKGVYFLIARPDVKDVQDLKGKTLGVSTMRGTDHLVTEEMLRAKGLNPSLLRAVALGDTAVRAQSLAAGAVHAVTVSPPHDLTLQKMGFQVLAGPPEIGLPASGLFTSDRLIKENPQVVRRTLRALMKANRFIADNRDQTIGVLLQWIPQAQEIAARSYDLELKATTKDGQMSDAELESLIERLGDKKKPLDEIRDFSHVRQALKELAPK